MHSLVIAAAAAFVISAVLTPVCRNVAIRLDLLDQPDFKRKIHLNPIPRIGGLPIMIAYLGSFIILILLSFRGNLEVRGHLGLMASLIPASGVVFATGLFDDILGLKAWQKLVGQFAAAVLVFSAGIHLTDIGGYKLPIWLALPTTILWLVGCTNAVNLVDGLDGLAAGVGFFASATCLMEALIQHNLGLAFATIPLAGALLGFSRYNFNPASVFLGDCGSLLIGFLLGCYSLLWIAKSTTIVGAATPLMVLFIPLLDMGLAIGRRFLRRQPILSADRGHIHHRLLARGLTPKRAVFCIYGVCGISAALALLASATHERLAGAILLLFCIGAWAGIRQLGYSEFDVARRMILGGAFRDLLGAQLRLLTFRESLAAAGTPDQCWDVLHTSYNGFGFHEIRLKLGGHFYSHTARKSCEAQVWTIRIALSDTDYLNLSHEVGEEASPVLAPFAESAGRMLVAKAAILPRPLHVLESTSARSSRSAAQKDRANLLGILHRPKPPHPVTFLREQSEPRTVPSELP